MQSNNGFVCKPSCVLLASWFFQMTILIVAQPAGEFRPGFAIDPVSEELLKETTAGPAKVWNE